MYEMHETRTVRGRSPQEVFDYVANPDHGAKWNSAAKSVRGEGEPGLGRKIIASAGILAFTFDITQEVTVWDPPTAYGWAGDKPVKTNFVFNFEQVGEDTKMTADVEFDPSGLVPKLMRGQVAKKFMSDFKSDLDTLVKLIESS
jgi:hypothetical protein